MADRISGPDTRALSRAIESYRAKGADAKPEMFAVDTALAEGMRVLASVRGFSLVMDEPAVLGGSDRGPQPAEVVLAALGACMEILYGLYAALEDIPLEEVRISLTGSHDARSMLSLAEGNPGLGAVAFETRIRSSADEAAIRRLVATVERSSPILDTLRRPVPVEGRVFLNGRPLNGSGA